MSCHILWEGCQKTGREEKPFFFQAPDRPLVSGDNNKDFSNNSRGTSLVVQWLRFWASHAGGVGLIPDAGTNIPQCGMAKTESNNGRNRHPGSCSAPSSGGFWHNTLSFLTFNPKEASGFLLLLIFGNLAFPSAFPTILYSISCIKLPSVWNTDIAGFSFPYGTWTDKAPKAANSLCHPRLDHCCIFPAVPLASTLSIHFSCLIQSHCSRTQSWSCAKQSGGLPFLCAQGVKEPVRLRTWSSENKMVSKRGWITYGPVSLLYPQCCPIRLYVIWPCLKTLMGSADKESACDAGDLGWEDPLEKGKATHSSILAWVAKSRTQLSDFHSHFQGPLSCSLSSSVSVSICFFALQLLFACGGSQPPPSLNAPSVFKCHTLGLRCSTYHCV